MEETSSRYDGMDTNIRKLSTIYSAGGSSKTADSSNQGHVITTPCSSLAQALEKTTAAHPVTPCPSDSSCCTDCGVSSSASYQGLHNHPSSWDQFPLHIPAEVQMTQKQSQHQSQQAQAPTSGMNVVHHSPASNAATNTPSNTSKSFSTETAEAQKRRYFLILVQIICKCLKQADATDAITFHCRKVIRECTQRNRQGDPNFGSLVDSATPRLRKVVGEKTWRRSIMLLKHYIQQQQQMSSSHGKNVVPI